MVHIDWVLLAEMRFIERLVAMMLVLLVAMSPILCTDIIRRHSKSAMIHLISAHVLVVLILIVASLVHLRYSKPTLSSATSSTECTLKVESIKQ